MAQHGSRNLNRLVQDGEARELSRRELMRLAAGGAGMTALTAMTGMRPLGVAAQEAGGGQVSMLWKKPVTLNPIFSTSGNEQQVSRLMFGALVKMSADLVPTPDLAASVDVAEDASRYTFKLHEGITFSDGTPLTAKDVVFTFERAIDNRVGSRWVGRLLGIAGAPAYSQGEADSITGIATPDDLTVEITLEEPNAAFLVDLCSFSGLGILPQHVLGEVPPDQLEAHPFSLAPDVSSGAFKFVRYETDQFLELERNPTYFGEPAPLERLFLKILTPDVGLAQLETGEINLMTLPVSEAERARGIEGVVVTSVPSPSMDFFALNLERPYLQDKRVRQAMMHAIDREGIVAQVLQGEGAVVNSPIFGPEWMGVPEGLNPYPYDVEKAKALIAEAGFDTSQKLEIMHLPGNNKEKDAAVVIIQEQLRQAGFDIDILNVDVATVNERYSETNDFDLFYNAGGVFRADPNVSASYFLTRNFTPNGGNGSHYSNPTVDDLYLQAQATPDQTERKRLYTEIATILNDEVPWLFFWSPNSLYAQSETLQGFEPPSYVDNKLWNAETWSVTE